MIDCHCHLDHEDYDEDREEVIAKCKRVLDAVVTCCLDPSNVEKTVEIVKDHEGFVYAAFGIHPIHANRFADEEIENFVENVKKLKNIVGVGEVGLDYHWSKSEKERERQSEIFRLMIELSKTLNLPLIVHSREAASDVIKILERNGAEKVLMHMFGDRKLLGRVIENGWFVSLNRMILKSKNYRKIARDAPLEKIMTETDSPWLGNGRNDPTGVIDVVKKIAEIKKVEPRTVDEITTRNAIEFFRLKIKKVGEITS